MKKKYNLFLDPVLWAGIFGIFIAFFFFYQASKTSKTDDSGLKTVGFIEKSTETVKIKPVGQLHWNLAQSNQNLAAGDFIFTGENSSGVLNLKDHGKLILGPHSMVIIQPGFIQVESGEVVLQASRNSIIKIFGSEIKVSPNSKTKIINTATESKIELSAQDQELPSNKNIVDKILVSNELGESYGLYLLGLQNTWQPNEGKLNINFSSNFKFDKIKLVIKNKFRHDKEFTTLKVVTIDELPGGTYQAEAFAYLNDELMARSELKTFEVINKKTEIPKVKSTVKEFEFFF